MAQEQYTVVARYRIVGPDGKKRVYHYNDVNQTGPSITLKAFHQGQRPPRPVVECYAPPDTGRLVVEQQAAQRAGQVPEAPPPPRPRVNHLACRRCQQVRCRCGVPTLGHTTEQVVTLQRQRGTRA